MGFTKLDEGIVLSSVWSESLATRVVWVTMLAMSNSNGLVLCSRSGLLRSANVPQEGFDEAIRVLEGPDPDSRSPEYDGRRIEKCDGGWTILNYKKYRKFTYSDSKEAIKKRKQREKGDKKGTEGDMSPKGGDISASASASELFNNFLNTITDNDRELWSKAYPACNIDIEIAKAIDYIKANPKKGRKSNYRRFFRAWLSRAQDSGGTKGVAAAPGQSKFIKYMEEQDKLKEKENKT